MVRDTHTPATVKPSPDEWDAFVTRQADDIRQRHREQDEYRTGVEIEDLLLNQHGEPATNAEADAVLETLAAELDAVEPEEADAGDAVMKYVDQYGDRHIVQVQVPDAQDPVPNVIENDLEAVESEVGTAPRRTPTDVLLHADRMTALRNGALPDGWYGHKLSLTPGALDESFTDDPYQEGEAGGAYPDRETYTRRKPRYDIHILQHGNGIRTIGTTASVQVSRQFRLDDDADDPVDGMFHSVYNGGDRPAVLALLPAVNAPFFSSPHVGSDTETDWYRREQYHRALGDSPFVNTDGTTKYGLIEDLFTVETVEDYLDILGDKIMQQSADVRYGDMQLRETGESVAEAYGLDPDETAGLGIGKDGDGTMTFREFFEQRAYIGVLEDPAGDFVEVAVDYTDADDFYDVATDYLHVQESFWWPELRARTNAPILENRIAGNSRRQDAAILTQMALATNYDAVQDVFHAEGFTNRHAADLWERVGTDGLDYELPSGKTLEQVFEESLIDVLGDGVREAFDPDTVPEYAATPLGAMPGDYEAYELDADHFRREVEDFVDSAVAIYTDRMHEYVERGTEAAALRNIWDEGGMGAVLDATRDYRTGGS